MSRVQSGWTWFLIALASLLLPASVPAAEFTWNGSTSGDWGVNGNWETPPTISASNGFVFTAPSASNLNTFLGDSARTIGGLTFNDNADSAINIYTYSNASSPNSSGTNRVLTFNNGAGNAWINVDAGATGDFAIAPSSGAGGRVTLGSNLVVTHNGSGNLEIGNWIDGNFRITKNGTGTFTLANANSSFAYSGMTLNAGRLRVASGNSLGGSAGANPFVMTGGTFSGIGAGTVSVARTLNFSGLLTFGSGTDTGTITFTSATTGTLTGNTTLHTNANVLINRVLGETGGPRSLTKTGPGTLTLDADNTFSGGLIINEGTVNATNSTGRLGAAGGSVTFDGGALVFTGGLTAFTVARNTTLNAGGGTIGITNPAVALTWSNAVSGTGGLTKTGSGTLVMDAAHTYTGGLNLNGGVYSVLNADNRLGASTGAVSFDGGTLLFRGGGSFSVNASRSTTLNAGGGTIDVLTPVVTATWAGAIGGAGGLTKTGSGGLTLTNNNTYTGPTAVSAGRLLIDGTTAAGSAVSVAAGAILGGTGTIGGNLTLANGALFAFAPGNTLTLGPGSTFALDSSFGVASLRTPSGAALNWDVIDTGTYTLLTGGNLASNFFSASNISDFGVGNAVTGLGTGGTKSAYFQNGSLQLVVVPEPGALGIACGGLLGLLALRRLRRA